MALRHLSRTETLRDVLRIYITDCLDLETSKRLVPSPVASSRTLGPCMSAVSLGTVALDREKDHLTDVPSVQAVQEQYICLN